MTGSAMASAAVVASQAARARRELSGLVLAATLRTVHDLDIAEESTADAFLLALQSWPKTGVPQSVQAWLITAARRRAIDRVRSAQAGRRALLRAAGGWSGVQPGADAVAEAAVIGDEELRMVVLCCDPRLEATDQVALTLRLACGVPTPAIAAAMLVKTPAMAARITRAKARLAAAGPALDLPDDATVDRRLPAVRRVVYTAFTLGHTAAAGRDLSDEDLADHAQYLAGVLHAARPQDSEITGLLALILLTRARATTRLSVGREQVLLEDADRSLWDQQLIERGLALAQQAWHGADVPGAPAAKGPTVVRGAPGPPEARGAPGPMTLQAAIAAEHCRAAIFAGTDWAGIVALYSRLLATEPSPTIAIGRSLAVSYLAGPAAGLADLDEVLRLGTLERYPYAFAARGQLLERLGRDAAAREEWQRAAGLARTDAERAFFLARAMRAAGTLGERTRSAQEAAVITEQGVAVPDDMATALAADVHAMDDFTAMRPDAQRGFVNWVGKASSAAERSQRLAEIGAHVRNFAARHGGSDAPRG